jgi:ADP-ribose pyrophosphatase
VTFGEGEPWEVLDTEYLLRSPWRDVRSDRLKLHNSDEVTYTYLEVPDAAFVVPLTVDGKIAVLRQYRHPPRAWAWEVVGGAIGEIVPLGSYFMLSASASGRGFAFLALDVELGESDREPMELLELVLLDPDEAFDRARDGRIDEAQSALALLMAEPRVRAHLAARADGAARPKAEP